ncbi:MAG TPA: hypothetical protein VN520_25305, partial [Streptomyces sp.]|uniref:hypothetical protein n=1 Tax=Streptomyces sp. TaxID=1931 RepID=UPI002C26F789
HPARTGHRDDRQRSRLRFPGRRRRGRQRRDRRAGGELLGEINRVPDLDYAYRHFRGIDGRVYGLNESKPQPR